jgi:hypothetical protein
LRSCSGGERTRRTLIEFPRYGRRCAHARAFGKTVLVSVEFPRRGRGCTRTQAVVRTTLLWVEFLGCGRCCAHARPFGGGGAVLMSVGCLGVDCSRTRARAFGERFSRRWSYWGAATVVLVLRRLCERLSCGWNSWVAAAVALALRRLGERFSRRWSSRKAPAVCAHPQAPDERVSRPRNFWGMAAAALLLERWANGSRVGGIPEARPLLRPSTSRIAGAPQVFHRHEKRLRPSPPPPHSV